MFLDGKVWPKSVDLATRMASVWLLAAKRRQATKTAPFFGSTAIFVPWLIEFDSEILIGFDQVFPQSTECENMILVDWLPVNRLQVM